MKKSTSIALVSMCLLTGGQLMAQTTRQQGVVRVITHSQSDPIIPIRGAAVQVNGNKSSVSNAKGQFSLAVPAQKDSAFHLQEVFLPKDSKYCFASPLPQTALYPSRNKLVVTVGIASELDALENQYYARLMDSSYRFDRDLRDKISRLQKLRMGLMRTEKTRKQHERFQEQADSLNLLLKGFSDTKNQDEMSDRLRDLAFELSRTDYQSLSDEAAVLHEARTAADWNKVCDLLLNDLMKGDVKAYVEKAKEASGKDWTEALNQVERLIEASWMTGQCDAVSDYFKVLIETQANPWKYLNLAGNFESDYRANYDLALKYLNEALPYATNNKLLLKSYFNIGKAYYRQGKYPEALKSLERTMTIQKLHEEDIDSDLFMVYVNTGNIFYDLGDNERALEYYRYALDMAEKSEGKGCLFSAIPHRSMGKVYTAEKQYDEAVKHYHLALDVLQTGGDKYLESIAEIYGLLGQCLHDAGRYEEGLEAFNRSIGLLKRLPECNEMDIAGLYHFIGQVYQDQEKWEESLTPLYQSLDLAKKQLSENDPALAVIHLSIANSLRNMHEFDEALKGYEKVLEGIQLHPEWPTDLRVKTCQSVGIYYIMKKQYDLAYEWQDKALNYMVESTRYSKNELGNQYNETGIQLANMGQWTRAIERLERAYQLVKADANTNPLDCAWICLNAGKVCERLNRFKDAASYLEEALAIYVKQYGPNHPETLSTKGVLNMVLYEACTSDPAKMEIFMQRHVIGAEVQENGAAYAQGLRGQYVLVALDSWHVEDYSRSVFEVYAGLQGLTKKAVLYQDGKFTAVEFEDGMGLSISIEDMDENERKEMVKAFRQWNKH